MSGPTTQAGRALSVWKHSDARPLDEFFDGTFDEAVAAIEAEAKAPCLDLLRVDNERIVADWLASEDAERRLHDAIVKADVRGCGGTHLMGYGLCQMLLVILREDAA